MQILFDYLSVCLWMRASCFTIISRAHTGEEQLRPRLWCDICRQLGPRIASESFWVSVPPHRERLSRNPHQLSASQRRSHEHQRTGCVQCRICHAVSNFLTATELSKLPPHAFLLSAYRTSSHSPSRLRVRHFIDTSRPTQLRRRVEHSQSTFAWLTTLVCTRDAREKETKKGRLRFVHNRE